MTACSNYQDKDYQGNWAPEAMTPDDLSNNTPDAPVVYFATTRYRAGRAFSPSAAGHACRWPATAGCRSILDVSGKQALRLTPGKHSLSWCWVSMNALGTGGAKCGFGAKDVEFRAGQRYVLDFSTREDISGPPGREVSTITINSEIRYFNTH